MHLAPTEVLHVFEAGNKRAEVQLVKGEKNTPFRVIYQTKQSGEVTSGSRYYTHAPDYLADKDQAIDYAKRWVYR